MYAACGAGWKVMRLLVISYLFPPVGGVGVQRALSLAKHLPNLGFEVHVLHARNAAGPVHDPALLKSLPPAVHIHGTFTPELPFHFRQKLWHWFGGKSNSAPDPSSKSGATQRTFSWKQLPVELGRRILCPEPEVLWVPFALRRARSLVRKHKIEAVLVTAPPFSAFLVGNALKAEFPHIKLITDFRDDWLRFYLGEFDYQKSSYTRRRAIAIEKRTVDLSDRVVVVTPTMLEHIRQRYPDQKSDKFVFIPNGYDPDSFAGFQERTHGESKIVVSHVGTVYSASSPRFYLDALDEMPDEIRRHMQTRFIGRIADSERTHLTGRKSEIKIIGFMPQTEALEEMGAADYLLLVMTDAASLTGKIFEYLATGKPILAIAHPDGEVARILQRTQAGWCAAPGDPKGIRDLIHRAYNSAITGHSSFKPNWETIRQFERPRLAREFGQLIRTA
jgi:glycosyltransferase involved in cell wall biosynthesis